MRLWELAQPKRLPPGAAPTHLAEAVAAIHRPIAARLEGDLGRFAALRANRGVHLARPAAESATATAAATAAGLAPPGLPARRAASRLVDVPLLLKELLLARRERESLTAVPTRKGPILERHR